MLVEVGRGVRRGRRWVQENGENGGSLGGGGRTLSSRGRTGKEAGGATERRVRGAAGLSQDVFGGQDGKPGRSFGSIALRPRPDCRDHYVSLRADVRSARG